MKIALVHNKFSTYGGAERYISNLTNGLLKRGHEVHIFAARFKSVPPPGVITHKVNFLRLGRIAKELSFAFFTSNINKNEEYDIVQGFSRVLNQDVIRAAGGVHRVYMSESLAHMKNKMAKKLKIWWRIISPSHLVSRYVEGVGFSKGHHRLVIALSEKTKKDILGEYNLSPESVQVIHNGFDPLLFYPLKDVSGREDIRKRFFLGEKDVLLLFVATNFPLKGLEPLLKAMSKIDREDVKLMVVGGGKKKPFEGMVDNLGLKDRVVFTGKQGDLLSFYHAADILVHPTIYDPFGNVCLEAIASGLPVITGRAAGFSDIVTHRENALIVEDPTDDTEIAGNINYLLDDKKRFEMRAKGIELSGQYTNDSHVEKVLDLYQEIVDLKKERE